MLVGVRYFCVSIPTYTALALGGLVERRRHDGSGKGKEGEDVELHISGLGSWLAVVVDWLRAEVICRGLNVDGDDCGMSPRWER